MARIKDLTKITTIKDTDILIISNGDETYSVDVGQLKVTFGGGEIENFIKNTDYASLTKAGIIKLENGKGTGANETTGVLYALSKNYTEYTNGDNTMFISKGTLENVLIGKDLTTKSYVDGLVGNIDTLLTNLNSGDGVE